MINLIILNWDNTWDFSVIADYSDTAEYVSADNMTSANWELIAVIISLRKLQIEKCTYLWFLIHVWNCCTQMHYCSINYIIISDNLLKTCILLFFQFFDQSNHLELRWCVKFFCHCWLFRYCRACLCWQHDISKLRAHCSDNQLEKASNKKMHVFVISNTCLKLLYSNAKLLVL